MPLRVDANNDIGHVMSIHKRQNGYACYDCSLQFLFINLNIAQPNRIKKCIIYCLVVAPDCSPMGRRVPHRLHSFLRAKLMLPHLN